MSKEKEREAWTKTLDLYKDLPYLWDKKHKDYFNKDARQEGYKMLLQVFNEDMGNEIVTLADFKKKLENMRTSYVRELKKVNASKQTGSGSSDVYIPSLWYYNHLDFLDGTTEPCRSGTDTMDENYSELSSDSPDVPRKPPLLKKPKISIQNKQEKLIDSAQALISQKEDDWEIIGKSIGIQLKSLNPHQQVIAQKLINDALFYGKLNKLTDESVATLSPQNVTRFPRYHLNSAGSPLTNLTNLTAQYTRIINSQSPQDIVNISAPSPRYKSSAKPSPQYISIATPSPQMSAATPYPQYISNATPSPQYISNATPSPQYISNATPSPQYISAATPSPQYYEPQTYEQDSSQYCNINPDIDLPNATFTSSNDIDPSDPNQNPESNIACTKIIKGTGKDMKEFLIFKKKN